MRTMQSTDPRWQHRVQMASVPFSQCRTRTFERGPQLTQSPTSTQFQTFPVVDLTKDHPVTRRSLGLDPSRHFRKAAAGAVPFSCSARRNCFLSNVQTVPPPRTTSITDTTDNRVQLVGMSLSNLARSDEWKHNVDYRFGNPNMNFRNIGIQVPPPAI